MEACVSAASNTQNCRSVYLYSLTKLKMVFVYSKRSWTQHATCFEVNVTMSFVLNQFETELIVCKKKRHFLCERYFTL